jgi:3-methyl-2-oxobutanoate hydroxymethyltransferase
VRAKEEEEADKLKRDALLLQKIGCFALVLEKIPAQLGKTVSESLHIPTIGIGAGPNTDGQVLVSHDLLGITKDFHPRFLRRYLELFDTIKIAVEQYIIDVKGNTFPNEKEQY